MRKDSKRLPIQTIALRTLAVSGGIAVALLAPNAVKLFKYLDRGKIHRERVRERMQQSLRRLEQKGYVEIIEKKGARFAQLTDRGHQAIEDILFEEYEIPEPAFWDGKWRIVMFDIPEKYRAKRDELRSFLKRIGFERLQQSVWVNPYPCDDCIELIRAKIMRRKGEIISFTAEGLLQDKELRNRFNVS